MTGQWHLWISNNLMLHSFFFFDQPIGKPAGWGGRGSQIRVGDSREPCISTTLLFIRKPCRIVQTKSEEWKKKSESKSPSCHCLNEGNRWGRSLCPCRACLVSLYTWWWFPEVQAEEQTPQGHQTRSLVMEASPPPVKREIILFRLCRLCILFLRMTLPWFTVVLPFYFSCLCLSSFWALLYPHHHFHQI